MEEHTRPVTPPPIRHGSPSSRLSDSMPVSRIPRYRPLSILLIVFWDHGKPVPDTKIRCTFYCFSLLFPLSEFISIFLHQQFFFGGTQVPQPDPEQPAVSVEIGHPANEQHGADKENKDPPPPSTDDTDERYFQVGDDDSWSSSGAFNICRASRFPHALFI